LNSLESRAGHLGTVLITGVSKRVGNALALELQRSGYQVLGTYRTERDSLVNLRNDGVRLFQVDFYQDNAATQLCEWVSSQATELRAIIHNASDWLMEKNGVADDSTFQRMMTVHVQVPYVLNLSLEALLNAGDTPTDIIHFTDYVADTGSAKHIAYSASKAAMANMSLSFAKRFAPKIKVNSIAPALLQFNPDDSPGYRDKALTKSLLMKEGGLSEAVDTVNYILNSGYITGRTLHLDGGRHLR